VAFVASGEVAVHRDVIEVGGRVAACGHKSSAYSVFYTDAAVIYIVARCVVLVRLVLYMCCICAVFFCILVMADFDFLKVEDNNHQNLLEAMSCNVHVLYFHLFLL
jgi:hypothetical protein